jgi:hypothetical protein
MAGLKSSRHPICAARATWNCDLAEDRDVFALNHRLGGHPTLGMSAFGGKADVAADDLEGDAMRLLGDGGQSDKAVVWPPSLFAYRQGPVSRSGHGACIAAVEDDCVISYSIVEPTRRTISGPCTAK